MKLNHLTPRNFINPLLSRKSADKTQFDAFKKNFEVYKQKLAEQLKTKQTEPNIVTNVVKPFFESLAYQAENYSQKGQVSIDLAIMQGITPSVLIEAKMPNSTDMITEANLNKKAFHQAILYFMNERAKDNKSLFHIVITDFNNWFVFDARDFDRLFWRNKTIKKHHDALTNQTLLGDRTEDFYRDIEKVLPTLQKDLIEPETIECAHFNTQKNYSDKELTAIYKLLSADCLLKSFNPNDANSLNKNFYDELLYILGLEESKEGGKKIIGQAKNKQNGTLFENISNKLGQYQKPNDFESVIKLIIIWVNRILFLKLLESQIVKWSGAPKFLDHNTLNQYDQLETLFFEVLAKPLNQRTVNEFQQVPYLNSSLFEIHPDEKIGITIATLADDIEIDYHPKTVLQDGKHRKTGKVSTLPYLLAFLDAYDFANDSDAELTNHSKTLINASVLGLIFEKINGYKDGSFYTPSFITMYMARETIEKTVVEKFNQAKGWQCKTLLDLVNKDYEIPEANAIINSIKICDPAVGSGHFLVSSLNELLRIKSRLKVLVDSDGERIKDYKLSIENDELIVMSDEGEQFEYKKGNDEKTRIQKTLFQEKQTLIENCLFGVDINPNSVNICRLRLWIELLKNAYYKENGELDTLPNIDINIKCGNSLISRFGLTDEFNGKSTKKQIHEYKAKVKQYKEKIGTKQDVLKAIEDIKAKFQTDLKASLDSTKKLNNALLEYVSKFGFDGLSTQQKLKAIDDLKLLGKQDSLFGDAVDQAEKNKHNKAVENAWQAVVEIENGKIYHNAFEWRFEFPEVLNEEGEFIGFDVVIGNPPYIKEYEGKETFDGLRNNEVYQGKMDIWYMFGANGINLLKENGYLNFIAPNNWVTNAGASKFRNFILQNAKIKELIDFRNFMVFESASIQTMIMLFKKTKEKEYHFSIKSILKEKPELADAIDVINGLKNNNNEILKPIINAEEFVDKSLTFSKQDYDVILNKMIKQSNFSLDEKKEVGQGIVFPQDFINKDSFGKLGNTFKRGDGIFALSENEKVNLNLTQQELKLIKPYFNTEQFFRYYAVPKNEYWLIYTLSKFKNPDEILPYPNIKKHLDQFQSVITSDNKPYGLHRARVEDFFIGEKIIVQRKCPKKPIFTYTDFDSYVSATFYVIKTLRLNQKFLAGLLNSTLIAFWLRRKGKMQGNSYQIDKAPILELPLLKPSKESEDKISDLVSQIILLKQQNQSADTSSLEAEIDQLVYALYGLTKEEIAIVEDKPAPTIENSDEQPH